MKTVINNTNIRPFKNAKVINQWNNGNYTVLLMDDGTKFRYSKDDELLPDYPESIDLCVTKKCRQGCLFCYENCTVTGKEADNDLINAHFWNDIPPYTEVAINGNDMDWRCLNTFLRAMKDRRVIVNVTVTISQFIANYKKLHDYVLDGWITAIGISLGDIDTWNVNFKNTAEIVKFPGMDKIDGIDKMQTVVNMLSFFNNIVFHSILGINDSKKLTLFAQALRKIGYNKPIKVLCLGYKTKGRGEIYGNLFSSEIQEAINNVSDNYKVLEETIDVLAFDNLAVEQLNLQNKFDVNEWRVKYLGNDGLFSMYIDGTTLQYCMNSCVPDDQRIEYKNESLKEIFQTIRSNGIITD